MTFGSNVEGKRIGLVVGAVLLVGAIYVVYLGLTPLPSHEAVDLQITIEMTPERVARGKKLVSIQCANCHYNAVDGALSGNRAPYPAFMGEIYSENLTQDPEAGIGKWTDGQLLYYLRTTIGPDGRQRVMSPEIHMADEDVESIIAFLKSDDPWVQPTPRSRVAISHRCATLTSA